MNIFKLSPQELELLPTEEDVAFYNEHGWYISKQLFNDDEVSILEKEMNHFYSGKRDKDLPVKPKNIAYWEPNDGDIFRINDYIIYENKNICSIITKPLIGAVAAKLSGHDVRVFNSSMMYKPPRNSNVKSVVGWHTDRAYWKTCSSDNMLTAWIPLHDTNEDIGTITMIDGSHKWSASEHSDEKTAFHFMRSDLSQLEAQVENNAGNLLIKKIPMILKKGQVSFHHCLTYHGSNENLSDMPRKAFSLHVQDSLNRYREFKFSNSKLATYNSDELCKKDAENKPDYTDSEFFPKLWSETSF